MSKRDTTRLGAIVASAVLILSMLAGCGAQTSWLYVTDREFPPRPSSHQVDVIEGMTDRPCHEIGFVFGFEENLIATPSREECLAEMKVSARHLGGDAIVEFTMKQAPSGSYYGEGVVVRWK